MNMSNTISSANSCVSARTALLSAVQPDLHDRGRVVGFDWENCLNEATPSSHRLSSNARDGAAAASRTPARVVVQKRDSRRKDSVPLILKPYRGSRGAGIRIIRHAEDLAGIGRDGLCLAQRYHEPDGANCKDLLHRRTPVPRPPNLADPALRGQNRPAVHPLSGARRHRAPFAAACSRWICMAWRRL
jgi:hypothetical protein